MNPMIFNVTFLNYISECARHIHAQCFSVTQNPAPDLPRIDSLLIRGGVLFILQEC